MRHKPKHPQEETVPDAAAAPEGDTVPEVKAAREEDGSAGAAAPSPGAEGALTEPPEEAISRLERELDALQDRHLRLAAEYDNFRRRTARERGELTARAQAELVVRLIDALDDLSRFAHVDPAAADAGTLHEGIDLVERKFWKTLSAAGLLRIDATGVPFDPAVHEAVTMGPAADAAQDNTVGTVLQPGYRLGDLLIRPARVLVLTWTGPTDQQAGDG